MKDTFKPTLTRLVILNRFGGALEHLNVPTISINNVAQPVKVQGAGLIGPSQLGKWLKSNNRKKYFQNALSQLTVYSTVKKWKFICNQPFLLSSHVVENCTYQNSH